VNSGYFIEVRSPMELPPKLRVFGTCPRLTGAAWQVCFAGLPFEHSNGEIERAHNLCLLKWVLRWEDFTGRRIYAICERSKNP